MATDLRQYPQQVLEQNLTVLKSERATAADTAAQLEKRIRELEQRQTAQGARALALREDLNLKMAALAAAREAHDKATRHQESANRTRGHTARALQNFHAEGAELKICSAMRAALSDLGVTAQGSRDPVIETAVLHGAGELIAAVEQALQQRLSEASSASRSAAGLAADRASELARADLAVEAVRGQIEQETASAAEDARDLKAARAGVQQANATIVAADKTIAAIDSELARRESAAKKTAKADA